MPGTTRRPPPPAQTGPRVVTGYHVESSLNGKHHITFQLRKGGTLDLKDLDATEASLVLDLIRSSGPRALAVWNPESRRLQWHIRSATKRRK